MWVLPGRDSTPFNITSANEAIRQIATAESWMEWIPLLDLWPTGNKAIAVRF